MIEGKKPNYVSAGEQTAAVNQENHFYRQTFVLITLQTLINSDIFPPNKPKKQNQKTKP